MLFRSSGEEVQQRCQGYLEDGYLQEPPAPLSALTSSGSKSFYPNASSVPIAEDPPVDDVMHQLLCSVLSQARSCLPGLSFTHKHGVTSPDEVMKRMLKITSFILFVIFYLIF